MAKGLKRVAASAAAEASVPALIAYDRDAEGIVADISLDKLIEDNMYVYGTMTVEDRSISDFRDGLLKVHRRNLWAMHTLGLRFDGGLVKSAAVVGESIRKYHPHGDQSIYGALVTMANMQDSLVHKSGNWGNMTMPAAAYRYTECKISTFAEKTVLDPYNMAVVEEVPNFDGQFTEPVVFVPNLPTLLIYGLTGGIAVGVTSEIPAFTVDSVRRLVRAALARTITKGKWVPVTARDCASVLNFKNHTGGHVISSIDEITAFMGARAGKLAWSADYEWVVDGKETYLSITGFPPKWGYKSKVEKFNTWPEVMQVASFNEKKGRELRVILKRASVPEIEAAQAKVEKALTSSVSYWINVIERFRAEETDETGEAIVTAKARFLSLSIAEMVNLWLKWRVGEHKKALEAELARLEVKLAREELLLRAIGFLDQMVAMLKTKGIDKVKRLAALMEVSEETAREIWQISIGRFDRLNEAEQRAKIAKLRAEVARANRDLKRPVRALHTYITAHS